MVSTTLTSQPFPLHKTNESRRRRTYSVKSSSSPQRIDKFPPVLTENTSRELLTAWDSITLPPVTAAKRLVLVRHGQSTWNAEGRIQGSSDFSVLTHKGESQAETSRQMLIQDSFDVCFSSPLARSKRTAEIVWDDRAEEIVTDSNLREIDLYSFQGLLKNEGKAKHGEAYRQWQTDGPNFIIDGHYPVRELWSRARSCWTRILTHESTSILVVAHNAVNQALVATALGLGTEYFRVLLQSNCGVSVLDFTPKPEGGLPETCLNRLNQTPSSPLDDASSGGRKCGARIILVSHGFPQNDISAQKTAELLLDVKVKSIVSSCTLASVETADAITKVQETVDCLIETKLLSELDVENIMKNTKQAKRQPFESGWLNLYEDEIKTELWDQSGLGWERLLGQLSTGPETENNVVAVGHPALHIAMVGHCLNLNKEWLGSFHIDAGSVSVVEFPDGPTGRGVIRCINYTLHLGRLSTPVTM